MGEIKIIWDSLTETYSIAVNGTTVLECLSEPEIKQITLGEVIKCYDGRA